MYISNSDTNKIDLSKSYLFKELEKNERFVFCIDYDGPSTLCSHKNKYSFLSRRQQR